MYVDQIRNRIHVHLWYFVTAQEVPKGLLAEYAVTYAKTGVKAEEKLRNLKVTLGKISENYLSMSVLDVLKTEDDGPYWCNVTVKYPVDNKISEKVTLNLIRK